LRKKRRLGTQFVWQTDFASLDHASAEPPQPPTRWSSFAGDDH
jgi:hypothetical protein